MTREEAKKVILNFPVESTEERETVQMAIKALEMLEKFERAQIITGGRLNGRTYAYKCGLEDGKHEALESDAELGHSSENELVCQHIKELPPVTPRSKKGHWISSHIPESILDECSECGFSCGAFTFNYCPNCGAKMIEPQESEE